MRRAALVLVTALLALGALVSPAAAHPLGNFTVNHLAEVEISADRIDVRYILDQAEIPTFQERRLADGELIERKREEIVRGLELTVDGRRVALRPAGDARLSHPAGQSGLRTTRLELDLSAPVDGPRAVRLLDRTFDGRVGWRAIVAAPGEGTAVRSSAPSGDPTDGLRRYPENLLDSPADQRTASFSVRPGDGTLVAPQTAGGRTLTTRGQEEDGFAAVFADAAAGKSVLAFLLLTAVAWGAFHALSPGHGKAMVAAYLVGTRGTSRHAVALGGVVTLTHTIGVFALGLVTLALSQYILPEDLYPWLNLVSGLLVVLVGLAVLRSRLGWTRARWNGGAHHPHEHADHHHDHAHHHHDHAHHHHQHDEHDHHGHGHGHGHHHHHHLPEDLSWRGVLGMGAAAGLIPCPSALVVLLAAISQHQVALGLLLIIAFSVGLAGTLTMLGIAVVRTQGLLTTRGIVSGRFTAALPTVSAVIILAVGVVLTLQAVPRLS